MTDGLLSAQAAAVLKPEALTAGMLFLASEEAPTHTILCAGGGSFERAYVTMTEGVWLPEAERSPEAVAAAYERISDRAGERVPEGGYEQPALEVEKALAGGA
jgi:hypothetical protein